MIGKYKEPSKAVLDKLGFSSIDEYYSSSLFSLLKRVLLKENPLCQNKYCLPKPAATQIKLLHFNCHSMIGYTPGMIFSLCNLCSLKLEGTSLFFAVSGLRGIVGRSNPKIGKWYRDQLYREPQLPIRKRLEIAVKKAGLYQQYWFNSLPEGRLFKADRTNDEYIAHLRAIILRYCKQSAITVLATERDTDGLKLHVSTNWGSIRIWTVDQLKWLMKKHKVSISF